MAKELSRTFDIPNGAIHLMIEDINGTIGAHTIYVLHVPNIPEAVAALMASIDATAEAVAAKMQQAGYAG